MRKKRRKHRPAAEWTIDREWKRETVVILGGGPSLVQTDVDYAIAQGWRRIAVNNAFVLDPQADALVWGDSRWYFWNREQLRRHVGQYKITWKYVPPMRGLDVRILRQAKTALPMSNDSGAVVANNSGQGAMNVAYHFGVNRIVLLGFDMQVGQRKGEVVHNWHNFHRRLPSLTRYQKVFAPAIASAVEWLKDRGVEVINCTPGSKLGRVRMKELRSLR